MGVHTEGGVTVHDGETVPGKIVSKLGKTQEKYKKPKNKSVNRLRAFYIDHKSAFPALSGRI